MNNPNDNPWGAANPAEPVQGGPQQSPSGAQPEGTQQAMYGSMGGMPPPWHLHPGAGYAAPPGGAGATPAGAPPVWFGQPGFVPPPHYAHPAYYAAQPAQMLPQATPTADQTGLESALNDMADKSGLGMLKGLFNFQDGEFWKGALVGAAVVMLLTNEELRNSLISGAAKTADAVKSGFGLTDEDDNEVSDDAAATDPGKQEREA